MLIITYIAKPMLCHSLQCYHCLFYYQLPVKFVFQNIDKYLATCVENESKKVKGIFD